MKRLGDFFQKGIDYLSAALLGTVIILVVFFSNVPRYISKSFLLPNGTLVLIAVGGWLLFVGACRFISEKRHLRLPSDEEGGEKQHMVDRAVVGLCVCLFFVQLYICYNIFFVTGWDPGTIWATALARVEGEVWNEMYFSRYPNNLLLLLLETALIKIHNMVGILPKEYAPMACIALDCAAITLACYFTYRELCLVTKKRYAVVGFLLCTVLAGLSPWMCVPYSDSFGILFPILSLYLYSTPRKTKWGAYWGKSAAVCVGCIGYYMKPQCVIPVIAIFCVELVRALQQKSLRMGGNLLPLLAVALLTMNLMGSLLTWKYESNGAVLDPEKKFGAAHFLMMGLDEKTNGVFDAKDVGFSESFVLANERNRADLTAALDRIRQMGPGRYCIQLVKKLLIGYSDRTFSWGVEGTFYKDMREEVNGWMSLRLRALFYSTGSKYPLLALAEQAAWSCVLLFAGIFELISAGKKNNPGTDVMKLTVLGAVLFMMLFETRARYTFLNVPIFCALAVQGMAALEDLFLKRRKKL